MAADANGCNRWSAFRGRFLCLRNSRLPDSRLRLLYLCHSCLPVLLRWRRLAAVLLCLLLLLPRPRRRRPCCAGAPASASWQTHGGACGSGPSALKVCDTWRPVGAGGKGAFLGAALGAGSAGCGVAAGGGIGEGVTRVLIRSEATVCALRGNEGAGAVAGGGWAASMDTATSGPGAATMPPVCDSRLGGLVVVGVGERKF